MEYQKKRDIDLRKAISSLDLELKTMNNDGQVLCDEYMHILNTSENAPESTHFEELMGMFDKQNRGVISFEDFGALWKYVSDWQNCFRSFDRDNSGNIDKEELKNALTAFGYRLSDEIVNVMVQKFDRFGRGTILFDDFIQCCVTLYTLTSAFRQYDTDQDGVITIHYEQFLKMVFGLKV
ncbi:Apoptosis-linked protein 2 [Operophtera brumata]|uniref:Apoptosis-linked protein 2 n=1 Tax=Operophtera brumata TaxID=104452 RepID=A0A0L7LAS0_OPEBR|nr:Apoptosis-linked protein 2 [Operophtera brumata]